MSPARLTPLLDPGIVGSTTVSTRSLDRFAMAHDASHYFLVPDGVATPATAEDVARVLAAARAARRPVAFRSGGTSLSGQAVTDGVLVDTRTHFRRIEVLDDGQRVRVQPGATVRQVNARLARHGRKLGPDPASEIACTIGGVIADNSSGMACGITRNSYRTVESLVLVLPDGTVLDTGAEDADDRLRELAPELHAGLARLRAEILGSPAAMARIEQQFSMKNTMGYGVNALVDFQRPVDILAHLVIGSEGTLAFVAEATFRTVELLPRTATGLLVFPGLDAATGAIPALIDAGFATIELMDARALTVAQASGDVPAALAGIRVAGHAALLVELQAADDALLEAAVSRARVALGELPGPADLELTTDAGARAALWHVRKGLYPTVAGARPSGTTALLEDIAVPVDRLLETCERLGGLFERHGYDDAVVFGHAKDGNLHFMIVERFDDPAGVERYRAFTEDLVDLVLAQGGSLKAEHGTGRVMAPFVRRQYGDELYRVMREIKRLCDPDGILNPGVVLSDEADSHLLHLKHAPAVETEVDRCVECGYCEPGCPSKDLTLTPRQRIALRRDLAAAERAGDRELAAELRASYDYDGLQTCAVDGMCAVACPVDIDTGDLVRRLRAERSGGLADLAWRGAAVAWGPATRAGGGALTLARSLPAPVVTAATVAARAVLGADLVPRYERGLPGGGSPRPAPTGPRPGADAVLFAACIGTMFGPEADGSEADGPGATGALLRLAERAGVVFVVPDDAGSLCCGTPWKSKGHLGGYRAMTDRVIAALLEASDGGRLPVVCDAASCTEGLRTMRDAVAAAGRDAPALRFVDAVEFARDALLPRLEVRHRIASLALHPTCSSTALGIDDALLEVGRAIADEVDVPLDWGCCAFAGDRGLLHPELTASATARETAEVLTRDYEAYASANRTCELGMTRATGRPYRHVLELLEKATRPAG